MDSVACGLADCVEMIHGSFAVMVYLDSAHKIVLGRNDRNTFIEYIITGLAAMFNNIWEMID